MSAPSPECTIKKLADVECVVHGRSSKTAEMKRWCTHHTRDGPTPGGNDVISAHAHPSSSLDLCIILCFVRIYYIIAPVHVRSFRSKYEWDGNSRSSILYVSYVTYAYSYTYIYRYGRILYRVAVFVRQRRTRNRNEPRFPCNILRAPAVSLSLDDNSFRTI